MMPANYCPPNVSSPFDCQMPTLANTSGASDPLPFVVIAIAVIVIAVVLCVIHARD